MVQGSGHWALSTPVPHSTPSSTSFSMTGSKGLQLRNLLSQFHVCRILEVLISYSVPRRSKAFLLERKFQELCGSSVYTTEIHSVRQEVGSHIFPPWIILYQFFGFCWDGQRDAFKLPRWSLVVLRRPA